MKIRLLILFLAMLCSSVTLMAQEVDSKPETQEEQVYSIVETMPSFPGGQTALVAYLQENLKYPQSARDNGIQGRVYVNFVVEKDGSISNVKVNRGIGGECDEEAVRVIKAMPKWIPGVQKGQTVRVSYMMPIVFKL